MIDILTCMCENNDYEMSDDLKDVLRQYFLREISKKDENFANARLARNIYDDLVMNHAKRVVCIQTPTDEDLSKLLVDDFKYHDLVEG